MENKNFIIEEVTTTNQVLDIIKIHEEIFNQKKLWLDFWLDFLGFKKTYFLILDNKKNIMGYYAIFKKSKSDYIAYFGFKESYRHKKYGKYVLEYLINNRNTLRPLTLHVNVNNEAALKLYLNAGFKKEEMIKKYYSNNDNAYLMRLKLI